MARHFRALVRLWRNGIFGAGAAGEDTNELVSERRIMAYEGVQVSEVPSVAILYRGPLRTSPDDLLRRIASLRAEFEAFGLNTRVFLACWNQDFGFLESVAFNPLINDLILAHAPSQAEVENMFDQKTLKNEAFGVRNVFYQYYLSKLAIEYIVASGNYTFIAHTRPDMDVEIGQFMADWLPGDDTYCTIHCLEAGDDFVNDQFSVATPQIMKRAWDYKNIATLKAYFSLANIPEDILQEMLNAESIAARRIATRLWKLDPNRFEKGGTAAAAGTVAP